MTSGQSSDQDLLARLNALKKSRIDLDTQPNSLATNRTAPGLPIDPSPARALHGDLLDRFKSLSGGNQATNVGPGNRDIDNNAAFDIDENKTVEELLADLGPAEQWNVDKSEHDHVEDLLRSAGEALNSKPDLEAIPGEVETEAEDQRSSDPRYSLPSVDVTAFQPEPDSDNEGTPRQTRQQLDAAINDEADDVLQRLLDEVRYEQQHVNSTATTDKHQDEPDDNHDDDNGSSNDDNTGNDPDQPSSKAPTAAAAATHKSTDPFAALSLPSVPSTLRPPPPAPTPTGKGTAASSAATNNANTDTDLAARFASLALPQALPSTPTTKPSTSTSSSNQRKPPAPTDEEIDSWCSICLDDATLSCLGCDGELYCNGCWVEGHRGEDAGVEERTHRAVMYNRRKGKGKKEKERRALVGA